MYRRWDVFCVNRWHSNRYYTINQGTEKRRDTKLKLLTWSTGILVCLGTDFLWKFDGVYRRWDAFCVNRWHCNRYYTINQGTEKRRDTFQIENLCYFLTFFQVMGARFGIAKQILSIMILFFPLSFLKRRRSILLPSKIINADNENRGLFVNWFFLWKFDGVYRRWDAFCVNRWHSNRYYTINQGTEKRRDTKLKLLTRARGILVCLWTDFLWKFDGVYRRWDVFCVNRWHPNRYYTINQGTEKRSDTKLKLLTWSTGILVCLGTDFCGNSTGCIGVETYFAWTADTPTHITQ